MKEVKQYAEKNGYKLVKQYTDKNGYKLVCLQNDQGEWKIHRVHRLIAQAYIPNPHNYPVVDHIDRNPANNKVENLRWASLSMNRRNCRDRKNKSGHTYITPIKTEAGYSWNFSIQTQYKPKKKVHSKTFKNKTDTLCYKYVYLLKLKAGIV